MSGNIYKKRWILFFVPIMARFHEQLVKDKTVGITWYSWYLPGKLYLSFGRDSGGPFYLVSMPTLPGEVKYPTCVTCST